MASTLPAGFSLEPEPVTKVALPEGFSVEPDLKGPASISEVAGDVGTELGVSLAGQGLGALTGPGYFAIAPAAGAYGNYLKQQREIERGERQTLSYGEMVTSALINAIPGGAAAKVAKPIAAKAGITLGRTGASKTAQIAEQAGIRAAEGAVIGTGTKAVEEGVEENRWPTLDEFYTAGIKGAGFGAGLGAAEKALTPLSKNASKLWNRLSGKTEQQVSQTLTEIRNTGSTQEREAAGEIIDVVGQNLGLVRSGAKSAEESAQILATKGAAEESARAIAGEQAVELSKREARILPASQQAARSQAQQLEAARLAAEAEAGAAARSVPGGFGQPSMAGGTPAPSPLMANMPQPMGPRPMGGFGSEAERIGTQVQGGVSPAAESAATFQRAVSAEAPVSAPAFERAYQEGQTQAGAMGLRARLAAEQQASIRAGDFGRARELADLASQIEANRLMRPEQMPSEAVLRATMVKPPGKVGRGLGDVLPTTEDVIQEFQNVPGIGGRAGARQLGLGASAAGGAALAEYTAPVDTYEIEHPDPRIGTLRYSAKNWTEDKILQDINKKEIELLKIDVASPQLRLREEYQRIQDAVESGQMTEIEGAGAQMQLLKDTPLTTEASAMAARVLTPIAGEQLLGKRGGIPGRMIGRVGGAMLGETIGSRLEGEPASTGAIVGAGIMALPEGKQREFAKNLLKFAGASVGAEVTKEAIDRKALLSFKQAASSAAEGGASAVGMKLMDKAASKLLPAVAKRGEYEMIKTMAGANELGLIVDPTIYANAWPRNLAMKIAGGNTKFQEAASRVNYPRMVAAATDVLGVAPETSLGRSFFLEQRELLSEPYKKIAAVSKKAASALEDWKSANEAVVANMRAAAAETNVKNRTELRDAARKAKDEAEKAFASIQVEAYATGNGHMVKDLTEARKQLSRMYAIKAASNEASGKIEYPRVWGEMYEAGVPFDGNLEKLARLSATIPEVLQPPSAIRRQMPIKGVSQTTLTESLGKMAMAGPRAAMAIPERLALETLMSSPVQRAMLLPPSGPQVSVPAQLGRFLTAESLQAIRPAPYR